MPAWRDSQVWLGDAALPVNLPEGTETLAIYPLDTTHVALAARSEWGHGAESYRSDGQLWKIDCRASSVSVLAKEDGADFGHAVAVEDQLYFSSALGVGRLHLTTGEIQRLVPPAPGAPLCSEAESLLDLVLERVQDTALPTLRVQRGNFCSDHGDWTAYEARLELGGTPRVYRPSPISSIARDASGRIWLATAGRCDLPGAQDLQAEGFVQLSEDAGATFRAVRIPRLEVAARDVLVDEARAGSLLVVANACHQGEHEGCVGCTLHLSRDAGKRFKVLRLPLPPERVSDLHVTAEGGSLTQLSVAVRATDGKFYGFRSQNAGASWRPFEQEAWPAPRVRELQLEGGAVLRASADGLLRREGNSEQVTFRLPEPARPALDEE